MKPLKVYLCDLTHETLILVSDTIPVNIGYVGSYAKHMHGDSIYVSLFKYPQTAIEMIKRDPPDILGLSNYSWNSRLSERVAEIAKLANPNVATVQGGTNFPHVDDQRLVFLSDRPHTDFHIEFEGEVSFSNLVTRVLESRDGGQGLYDAPIDGCVFIHPDGRDGTDQRLVVGNRPARLKNLDDIPSPYLNGMMDHFFDGRLSPFIETNRGCPFKCTFCHTGNDYFQKINMFSIERLREELEYIAVRASRQENTILHIADTNFGMFPRDREICETLLELQGKHNWPLSICSTTGKNNKERVIEITSILGNAFSVTMSVQSMDEKVLKNINRSNIKLDDYIAVNKHLQDEGRNTTGEMILGLPGETKDSFTRGVRQIIDSGVSVITIYSLMMLYGTEFKNPDYQAKFDMEGKYRIVPLNFGEYDGVKIFDYEEVCVKNKDMSFEDYLDLRRLALSVETIHNNRPFEPFFRYALTLGMARSEFLFRVLANICHAPEKICQIYEFFNKETREELWDSDEEMIEHYQSEENFKNLLEGKIGGNLIYKYKSMNLATAMPEWILFLTKLLKDIVAAKTDNKQSVRKAGDEIDALSEFCQNRVWKFLDPSADDTSITMESDYDFVAWLRAPETAPLSLFSSKKSIPYEFSYTEDQLKERQDQFRRYGTDINALSKIVTRVHVENLLRTVWANSKMSEDGIDSKKRARTRYALSN